MEQEQTGVMGGARFSVIFKGQFVDGISEETIRHELSATLKLSANAIETILSSPSLVLKRNIDLETAERYQRALKKTGVLCQVVPAGPGMSTGFTGAG